MKSDGARGKFGAGDSDSLMAAWLAEDTETLKGGTGCSSISASEGKAGFHGACQMRCRVAWFNGSFNDARMPPCVVHVRYISVVVEPVISWRQELLNII